MDYKLSCTNFLDQRTVKEPPTHTLTRLAELVLTLSAFPFNGQHYRLIGSVAMGSKMAPNYACLFVGFIEEQICSSYTGFVAQLHKRYIDDYTVQSPSVIWRGSSITSLTSTQLSSFGIYHQ